MPVLLVVGTIFSLPLELIDIIFTCLSKNDLFSLVQVSHQYNDLVHDPYFWRRLSVKRVDHVGKLHGMIASLSKWHHLHTLHLNVFNWVISGPMIGRVVDACPQLVELKVRVYTLRGKNYIMTPLSNLTNLKKLVVESNFEAFAPSFTLPALECWSGLRVLEFSQTSSYTRKHSRV